MEMTGFESAVVLGACILPLIRLVVAAIVGYFVVKKAVLAALREHERTKSRESPISRPSPDTFGACSIASVVARASCAGSAPIRSMMTEMLRSPPISSAESR